MSTVEIEKLVYGGDGLARLGGRVAFVPFVLPGERVVLKEPIALGRKSTQEQVSEYIELAKERVGPICPIFTRCGGCHYQHIPYPLQLSYKIQILRETLARLGKVEWSHKIETVSGNPWGYRNRTRLHVSSKPKSDQVAHSGGRQMLGFFEANSHRIVESANCPINSPGVNRAHEALAEIVRDRRFPKFITEIECFSNESDILLRIPDPGRPLPRKFFELCADNIDGLTTDPAIDYRVGNYAYQVASGVFFQVNRFLVEHLVDHVITDAEGGNALDLYAGVGVFGVPMAERFGCVQAVDSNFLSVRCLQENASRAGVSVQAVHLSVEEYMRGTTQKFDFVVADPPRTGLGPVVAESLVRIHPTRLALVSCDPSTLARDLRFLVDGGFSIEKITLVDLFPQTYHIETVVQLV